MNEFIREVARYCFTAIKKELYRCDIEALLFYSYKQTTWMINAVDFICYPNIWMEMLFSPVLLEKYTLLSEVNQSVLR